MKSLKITLTLLGIACLLFLVSCKGKPSRISDGYMVIMKKHYKWNMVNSTYRFTIWDGYTNQLYNTDTIIYSKYNEGDTIANIRVR